MESKKINQLATSVNPSPNDLAIIGDPITGVSKKITWLQVSSLIGTASDLQQVTDNGATTTNPITIGGLTISGLSTGVLKSDSGVISSVPFGGANGVATLGGDGKVPSNQLPSYVDDVVEVANYAALPVTGETGKIYITLDNNKVYRWTGSTYVEIAANNAIWGAITGTLSSQTDLQNALDAKVPTSRTLSINGTSYDLSANRSWSVGTVTSVGLTSTAAALSITNSPITSSGNIGVNFAGSSTQYVAGDGSLVTFPTIVTEAQNLITDAYNETGATLTKGTVVYINGGHGNLPTITKALATGDSTSAQTYGVVQADITNNNNGYVVAIGRISNLDTQAYAAGTQLYLSPSIAGTWTSTKPYAPDHLVYVGIVVRSHPTQGVVEVKIMNGFELEELHNVSAQSPSNNDGIFYNTSTSLWEKKSVATALGYTPISGSGTTDFIPKFTGSTSVGNSSMKQVASAWIQLGNQSDNTSIFELYGSNGSKYTLNTGQQKVSIQAYLNSAFTILSTLGSTNTELLNYDYTSKFLSFGTNGTEKLRISSSGNVSIGNVNDTYKLEVTGTTNITGQLILGSTITNGTYTYTLPSATGTLALTSDIPSLSGFVTIATTQTITGDKTFTGINIFGGTYQTRFTLGIALDNTYSGGGVGGHTVLGSTASGLKINLETGASNNLYFASTSVGNTYTFPNATGTIALTSDIPSLAGYVPTSRTLTINGTTYDLSADRSWSITAGVSSVTATSPLFSSGGSTPNLTIQPASVIQDGYLSSTDWNTFNNKQSTITLTTTGTSGAATFSGGTLNIPNYTTDLSAYVPNSRTLTINGTTYDLSADRSWTISSNINSTTTQDYTATAGQTVFTVTGGYTVGQLAVYYNGSKLAAAEFTATNGTTFTLATACQVNDIVQAVSSVTGGGIGGSGTTNYIPKFTASGTVGDSIIYNNGTGIGIGTSSPSSKLEVYKTDGSYNAYTRINLDVSTDLFPKVYMGQGLSGGYIGYDEAGDERLVLNASNSVATIQFLINSTERMRITSAGTTFWGRTSNWSTVGDSTGAAIFQWGGIYAVVDSGEASVMSRRTTDGVILLFRKNSTNVGSISTNTYSLPSDKNFKKNINTLDLGLNLVNKLRPVSYNHKIDDDNSPLSTGFIAQEMEQVLTDLGITKNEYYILQNKHDDDKTQSQYWLDYTKMIPVLVKAIQEQQAQIEELKAKIK